MFFDIFQNHFFCPHNRSKIEKLTSEGFYFEANKKVNRHRSASRVQPHPRLLAQPDIFFSRRFSLVERLWTLAPRLDLDSLPLPHAAQIIIDDPVR